MTYPLHVVFCSYGNDSVALLQFAYEQGLPNTYALYSDTGWAAKAWPGRVEKLEEWARARGITPVQTKSIGLARLVHERKGWPRQGMQFCTYELKIKPAMAWLEENDDLGLATCLVGVRREESANRASFPERCVDPNYGGRVRWAPLVSFSTEQRNQLLARAGVEPLPHRSDECFPCINSNRADLRRLAQDGERVEAIAKLEERLGVTSKGAPRTMFRPYRYMGATGIKEVVRWSLSERGKFNLDDGTGHDCDSGYCGV